MATTYKVLGQSAPASTANANAYTVPAATQAVVSTIAVTNVTAASALGRIYVRIAGATAALANAFVYDVSFDPNSTTTFTCGITLGATDVITVQTTTANALTFHIFGSEIA